jgi:uncharacterized membrane protein
MILKILSVPFRIIGGSVGLLGNMIKLVLLVTFGTLKFLLKNSFGVVLGIFGGFFVAKKILDEPECTCNCTEEKPVDQQNGTAESNQ